MPAFSLVECLGRLATRNPGRTEADIQSDVRDVLLYGDFDLGEENVRLESPAPDQRRIDVEVGALVVECKRDLRPHRILADGEVQLGRYLSDREGANGGSYVGVLTDGVTWRCYRTIDIGVEEVSTLELRSGLVDERRFRWWLGSLLATERLIVPTTATIEERLGSESPGCQLALKELRGLWLSAALLPEVQLKRALWAKLLRTALGTQFADDDGLFIEHTYLVLVATLIAHVVIGFEPSDLQRAPAVALSGQLFAQSNIRGVGEAGFFDWVLDVPGGNGVVADLARRLAVFSWSGVDHDVLKALYQSVISPDTRHRLGEYYTPDWLAKGIVERVITEPLRDRVLDPACGSGTFLFHAIRHFLHAAELAGVPLSEAVSEVPEHIFGMDLHPVAVVLAQVTYLLAIGPKWVADADVPLSVPVYLGDSMRWEAAEETFFSPTGEVVVPTGTGQTMFATEELRFPASVVSDPGRFDRLVDAIATRATDRKRGEKPLPIGGLLTNFAVSEADRPVLEATYRHLCDLHDQERNHIWGFYVRNQARPTWFAALHNRVDVLVGNPPWLSYRYMPKEMQIRFNQRARDRHLWHGGKVATQQDLSAYFVVRSVELYLRTGGRFGFVMPLATLSRQAYVGFRAGDFSSKGEVCAVAFETPWDLDDVTPDPFPVPSSVVFGKRVASSSHTERVPLPTGHLIVAGRVVDHAVPDYGAAGLTWTETSRDDGVALYTKANSPYVSRFRDGATLYPRLLALVIDEPPGPLPLPKTQRAIRSRRGKFDKDPWRSLPDETGVVEEIFIRRIYLGEHCLPFRMLSPVEGVVPFDGRMMLSGDDERIDRYPGLARWWRGAERTWEEHKQAATRLSLLDQIDYMHKLSAQFPIPATRVVYTKAGNYLTAAIVDDPVAIIDHKLYWGATATIDEARFLTAFLNAPALGELVAPYQSRGAFGARDFDKYVWYPPIPEYDASDPNHEGLVGLATRAEAIASEINLAPGVGFQKARGQIRTSLLADGVLSEIDATVNRVLDAVSAKSSDSGMS